MALLVFFMVVLVDVNILAAYYYSGMGYEFLTSIILVISIGFSVDYSAHVAYVTRFHNRDHQDTCASTHAHKRASALATWG